MRSVLKTQGRRSLSFLDRRWLPLFVYGGALLWLTPYLPSLIGWASSRWTEQSVERFVLAIEGVLGALLIGWVLRALFSNRSKFLGSLLLAGGAITSACVCYWIIPNPYELTHLPEYAVLYMLLIRVMKRLGLMGRLGVRAGCEGTAIVQESRDGVSRGISPHLASLCMVSAFGAIDELYQRDYSHRGFLPGMTSCWTA